MTIREIIKDLKEAGYNVSFYERKDGGIRITRINGQTFSGSHGNQRAREIVGASLSEARVKALGKLKTPKGKGSYNKRRKEKLSEETKKEIQRLQRLYRKAGKGEGKPTIRNYRYILKTRGKKEAERLLKQAERRIMGYAYPENVNALLSRIKMDMNKLRKVSHENLKRAYERIKELRNAFLDKWIYACYEILYQMEMRILNPEEAGSQILAIIG